MCPACKSASPSGLSWTRLSGLLSSSSARSRAAACLAPLGRSRREGRPESRRPGVASARRRGSERTHATMSSGVRPACWRADAGSAASGAPIWADRLLGLTVLDRSTSLAASGSIWGVAASRSLSMSPHETSSIHCTLSMSSMTPLGCIVHFARSSCTQRPSSFSCRSSAWRGAQGCCGCWEVLGGAGRCWWCRTCWRLQGGAKSCAGSQGAGAVKGRQRGGKEAAKGRQRGGKGGRRALQGAAGRCRALQGAGVPAAAR